MSLATINNSLIQINGDLIEPVVSKGPTQDGLIVYPLVDAAYLTYFNNTSSGSTPILYTDIPRINNVGEVLTGRGYSGNTNGKIVSIGDNRYALYRSGNLESGYNIYMNFSNHGIMDYNEATVSVLMRNGYTSLADGTINDLELCSGTETNFSGFFCRATKGSSESSKKVYIGLDESKWSVSYYKMFNGATYTHPDYTTASQFQYVRCAMLYYDTTKDIRFTVCKCGNSYSFYIDGLLVMRMKATPKSILSYSRPVGVTAGLSYVNDEQGTTNVRATEFYFSQVDWSKNGSVNRIIMPPYPWM